VDDRAVVHREVVAVVGQFRHGEAGVGLHHVVGVDEQEIARALPRPFDRLRAAQVEAFPRALVQRSGEVGECLADDVLGSVGRARVKDHPRVDEGEHGFEAAPDHMRLVLDDHIKTDRFHGFFFSPAERGGW
jgi:hypothetical protein